MSPTVFINGRGIARRGSGGGSIARLDERIISRARRDLLLRRCRAG
jgi:hypothetical protein